MSNNDISQLGEEIKDAVQSAIDRGDFTELNDTIGKTVGIALDRFGDVLDRGGQILNEKLQNSQYGQNGSWRNNGQFENRGTYNQHFDGNYRQVNGEEESSCQDTSTIYQEGSPFDTDSGRADNSDRYWYNDAGSFRRKLHTQGWEKKTDPRTYGTNPDRNQSQAGNTDTGGFPLRNRFSSPLVRFSDRYENPVGARMAGMIAAMAGGVLTATFGLTEFFIVLSELFEHDPDTVMALLVMAPFLAGSALCLKWGLGQLGLVKRFKKYIGFLGDKEYCDVEDLEGASLGKRSNILKDLKKMIKKGWFRHGYLDQNETSLMVTREAYTQYLEAKKEYQRREAEEQRLAAESVKTQKERQVSAEAGSAAESEASDTLPAEVRAVILEGREYLRQIRQSNDAIPGEEISAKISRLEQVTDQIFDRVEEHPELVDELRRFMKYYLPTTVKLLNAYEELDSHEIESPNITKSKAEIEKTLDTINHAFENLLDSFFETDRVDIMSDISVMQTMMSQEGLLGSQMQTK